MKIDLEQFRVRPDKKVNLSKWPTKVKPYYSSREQYHERIEHHREELSHQQSLLYANNTYSLLLIFQAMDAAGKDSAIKHVMSGVNPQGCQVTSFKHPSATELAHDFLWRTTRESPERGRIGIFNRSYYEEVLIVRVQPDILRAQLLPPESLELRDFWGKRYESISGLEKHLHRNGTRIVKFFLHVSKEEQKKRLLDRIDDPEKNWKFAAADIEQRKSWHKYQKAYEDCLSATSSRDSPWYAVPADDKPNAHLIISTAILDTLKGLGMSWPTVDGERKRELQGIRRDLA